MNEKFTDSLKLWQPVNEMGEITLKDFDVRFPIDRTYTFIQGIWKYRIRFVKHPDCRENEIKVFTSRIFRWKFIYQFIEKHIWLGKFLPHTHTSEIDNKVKIEDKYNIVLDEKWQARQKKIDLIIN